MAEELHNCDDVKQAVAKCQRENPNDQGEQRAIIRQAVDLGCTEHIPDDWGLE